MVSSPSRARVTARLAQLRDRYGGFDVRQTTVSVHSEEYEANRDSAGEVLADVRVRNDAGELLSVEGESGWQAPMVSVGAGEPLVETVEHGVERLTGVRARVQELDCVAIVCVHDADDPDRDALYQLHARFDAAYDAGVPRSEGAAWRAESRPETALSF
ncbi:hypothetical protein [Natronomonas sp. EA1]|uniref:hypothetical protein n=1 Tax=Natronomonas sp. EA1 TaxID=3421655 RepID=UPI003EC0CD66